MGNDKKSDTEVILAQFEAMSRKFEAEEKAEAMSRKSEAAATSAPSLPPEKLPPRIGQRWAYEGRLYRLDRVHTDGFLRFVDEKTGEPFSCDPIEWQKLTATGVVKLIDRVEVKANFGLGSAGTENFVGTAPTEYRDERRIDNPHDMPFAPDVADRMRAVLKTCGCVMANDVAMLGCTGAMKKLTTNQHEAIGTGTEAAIVIARFVRFGMAGTGCGLPCFVPLDRWCLVHETYGGLQRGQASRYVDMIPAISRELTPQERVKVAMLLTATRTRGMAGAENILLGIDEEKVEEIALDALALGEVDPMTEPTTLPAATGNAYAPSDLWTCDIHAKPDWSCRYCAAQMVVEGDLAPTYTVSVAGGEAVRVPKPGIDAPTLLALLDEYDAAGVSQVCVQVRVATFTRKLSRG